MARFLHFLNKLNGPYRENKTYFIEINDIGRLFYYNHHIILLILKYLKFRVTVHP